MNTSQGSVWLGWRDLACGFSNHFWLILNESSFPGSILKNRFAFWIGRPPPRSSGGRCRWQGALWLLDLNLPVLLNVKNAFSKLGTADRVSITWGSVFTYYFGDVRTPQGRRSSARDGVPRVLCSLCRPHCVCSLDSIQRSWAFPGLVMWPLPKCLKFSKRNVWGCPPRSYSCVFKRAAVFLLINLKCSHSQSFTFLSFDSVSSWRSCYLKPQNKTKLAVVLAEQGIDLKPPAAQPAGSPPLAVSDPLSEAPLPCTLAWCAGRSCSLLAGLYLRKQQGWDWLRWETVYGWGRVTAHAQSCQCEGEVSAFCVKA